MNLENLETKQHLIKEFFTWLFDDERIINKEVSLQKETDLSLAAYYMDPNIYYPEQIANFFNTKAMQRLGRISQLDLAIDEFPNVYHNRLEHSKGVYNRKLEEMLYNFQNPMWREQIEKSKMKPYFLAELIKISGHDIGHLPLSHALEIQIFNQRTMHEVIGKRIMLEDTEIQSVLKSISPDLPEILQDLYKRDFSNFHQHDESNYDVDRFDYIFRDNLYAGNPIFVPYSQYKTVNVPLNSLGFPEINSDSSIKTSADSDSTIDVYDYNSLQDIEHFLEIRENGYNNIYFSHTTHIRENTIGALFKTFLSSNSNTGKNLRTFVETLQSCDINNIDLSLFLEWDDIKFYSEILDIAEYHETPDVRLLATMTIPKINEFLTMIYSHLNLYNEGQHYSIEDKKFLQNLKRLIKGNNALSENLRNPNFAMNNTLIFPIDDNFHNQFINMFENGFIKTSTLKVKSYNPNEPIYIMGKDNKIYELSHHPDRKYDWNNRIKHIKYIYTYIPYLRFYGFSDDKINELANFSISPLSQNSNKEFQKINMQPLQVGHNIEDCFLEL